MNSVDILIRQYRAKPAILREGVTTIPKGSRAWQDAGSKRATPGDRVKRWSGLHGDMQRRRMRNIKCFDYGNQLGVSTGCIAGLKATRYNSADFGKIVVSTAHSAAARSASQRS